MTAARSDAADQIAAKLSKAQREALIHRWDWRLGVAKGLKKRGLVDGYNEPSRASYHLHLTPLGQAVRCALEGSPA